jgi:predicted ATPase/DNA-binding SARP family transcriptional activator/Tfp pilus assembly protein PilF
MTAFPALWRIELLGTLSASRGTQDIIRFKNSNIGECLAYCAYHIPKTTTREELAERIWPDADDERARQSLRQVLLALRRQLEPPDVPPGSVIIADKHSVRLNATAVTTDIADFKRESYRAEQAGPGQERVPLLAGAVELYGGDLLPGYDADWIVVERERLAATYARLLRLLVSDLRREGEHERAIDFALRAVGKEPLRDELCHDLMLLYAETGRPQEGLRTYERLERLLTRELGTRPSETTNRLARRLRASVPGARPERAPSTRQRNPRAIVQLPALAPAPPLLPHRHTRFFGREDEIEKLLAWLGGVDGPAPDRRLVTLIGPGGAGKTRLALETMRRFCADKARRAYFIPLADLSEPGRLLDTIAAALRLPPSTVATPLERIVAGLVGGPALLVLDNMEHLVETGAEVAEALLTALPQLTLLVTSRQHLDMPAERVFPVPPLAVPGRLDSPADLVRFASVQLFLDRARAVCPEFQVTRRNAAALAVLCIRLEGIPLAIELAAARTLTLTPAQMLVQLADRFTFLVSRQRTVETRHRTLRACLDWSVEPLPGSLRRTFAALAVFRGGWTLDAAQEVSRTTTTLTDLEQLCSRSLVLAEEVDGETRYRLLDSVREYAMSHLSEDASEPTDRHAAYYLDMAERAAMGLRGPQMPILAAQLEREHDNLRAVLTSTVPCGVRLRLAAALWRFWYIRGYFLEGYERLTAVLAEAADGPPAERGRALAGLGWQLSRLGRYPEAQQHLEESLVIRRSLADKAGIAETVACLALIAGEQGNYVEAIRCHDEALAIYRILEDSNGIASALNNLGITWRSRGDLEQAGSYFSQSVDVYRQLGHVSHLASALNNLATVDHRQGRYAAARAEYQEGLALFEQAGNELGVAIALHNLADSHSAGGDLNAAIPLLIRSLRQRQKLGDRSGMPLSLELLANIARIQGDAERAARLLFAAQDLRRLTGKPVPPVAQAEYERDIALIHAAAGETGLARARAWASVASLDEIVEYACAPNE